MIQKPNKRDDSEVSITLKTNLKTHTDTHTHTEGREREIN